MSGKEIRRKYIFAPSTRTLKLSTTLAFVSGSALAIYAGVPGVEDVRGTAELVGGLTAQELLALVAVIALALAAYCVRVMVGQNAKATIELTKIADRMALMRCVRDTERKSP